MTTRPDGLAANLPASGWGVLHIIGLAQASGPGGTVVDAREQLALPPP